MPPAGTTFDPQTAQRFKTWIEERHDVDIM
jgi:hypothetical protein